MAYEEVRGIPIEGRKRFIYRNFKGEEKQFNRDGDRNFCILLDEEEARLMASDKWNVKWTKPRDEDDVPQAFLKVNVSYKYTAPKVVVITNTKVLLTEETIHMLDWAEIENADLTITPHVYNDRGQKSAYLKTMYVTLAKDDFEEKYRDIPFGERSSLQTEEDEIPF